MARREDSMHILRAGRFRDVAGREVEISDADLAELAENYRPREANLILGHFPGLSDPSLAHVAALAHTPGRGVDARLEQVTDEARELTRSGKYTRCSAFVRRPKTETPWRLVHVGLLGAHAPAVTGLDEVRLAAPLGSDEQALIVEMPLATAGGDRSGMAARLAAMLAAALRGGPDLDAPPDDPPPDDPPDNPEGDTVTAQQEAALAARQTELDRRISEVDAMLARQRRAEAESWAQDQADAGRILPRHAAPLSELTAALAALSAQGDDDAGDAVMLAATDDDGGDSQVAAADWLRSFVESLPTQIDYSERSGPGAEPPGQVAAFAATGADRQGLHERALAIAAKQDVDYQIALLAAADEAAR